MLSEWVYNLYNFKEEEKKQKCFVRIIQSKHDIVRNFTKTLLISNIRHILLLYKTSDKLDLFKKFINQFTIK